MKRISGNFLLVKVFFPIGDEAKLATRFLYAPMKIFFLIYEFTRVDQCVFMCCQNAKKSCHFHRLIRAARPTAQGQAGRGAGFEPAPEIEGQGRQAGGRHRRIPGKRHDRVRDVGVPGSGGPVGQTDYDVADADVDGVPLRRCRIGLRCRRQAERSAHSGQP